MSVGFREDRLFWLWAQIFTWRKIISRIPGVSLKGFPMSHISSFIYQAQMRKAYKLMEIVHLKDKERVN